MSNGQTEKPEPKYNDLCKGLGIVCVMALTGNGFGWTPITFSPVLTALAVTLLVSIAIYYVLQHKGYLP